MARVTGECWSHWKPQHAGRKGKKIINEIKNYERTSPVSNSILVEKVSFHGTDQLCDVVSKNTALIYYVYNFTFFSRTVIGRFIYHSYLSDNVKMKIRELKTKHVDILGENRYTILRHNILHFFI